MSKTTMTIDNRCMSHWWEFTNTFVPLTPMSTVDTKVFLKKLEFFFVCRPITKRSKTDFQSHTDGFNTIRVSFRQDTKITKSMRFPEQGNV
jgi:hypothetical protein